MHRLIDIGSYPEPKSVNRFEWESGFIPTDDSERRQKCVKEVRECLRKKAKRSKSFRE